jgi:hypothetical protein
MRNPKKLGIKWGWNIPIIGKITRVRALFEMLI